jgi:DNA processing protein
MTALDAHKVAAATVAALPQITRHRLRRLVAYFGGAVRALEAVRAGHAARALRANDPDALDLARTWRRVADPDAIARELTARGTHVWVEGDEDYPVTRPTDDDPVVLFGEGLMPEVFERPRVGVVGTRSATPHGLADAKELGVVLGRAGATVISGLALGIDGAAHEGVVAANGAAVGVVATGLDVEYPRRHRDLYRDVRAHGVVVSEHWYGVPPDRPRFPVRNRIIAALADVVAVVEATSTGGARITAQKAADYGRPVLAMPGSRRNPAAAGCNELLRDGAGPLLAPSDVLESLELAYGGRTEWRPPPPKPQSRTARTVWRALGGEPATVDDLIVMTQLAPADVISAVRDLEQSGAAKRVRGYVWPQ